MQIEKLHHVQITIPIGAENQARGFYCDLLGMRETEKPQALQSRGGLWLELGDMTLHLGVEDGVDRGATKAHLGYQVDDLDSVRARLQGAGIAIADDVAIPGLRRLFIRDPFGNRIEFVQLL
ncbi:MAG: VOC family protein [Proteobacteria bacterium]|nr:VOC family protein [Pseudomonadota bacterium]